MRTRAKVIVFALTLCTSMAVGTLPAHADNDNVENHLCLDTGLGIYGVSDHVNITATTGTYHISTFGQASAWTYYGTGQYCRQNSVNLPCSAYVYEVVFQNGNYLATTPTYQNSGVHTVSTGSHSYGTFTASYVVESFVTSYFGNSCTSEADGVTFTFDTD